MGTIEYSRVDQEGVVESRRLNEWHRWSWLSPASPFVGRAVSKLMHSYVTHCV